MSKFLRLANVLSTQEYHVHTATNDVWIAMLPPKKSDRILRSIADVVGPRTRAAVIRHPAHPMRFD